MIRSPVLDDRPRLLVVDDEPAVIPIVERFASQLGFQVESRAGGAEALSALPGFQPHVVLVDLQMPGLGGLDVLTRVKSVDPECQVILMTGNATVETAMQAVKEGALDYLSKPFDFERLQRLLTTVREGLERREGLLRAEAAVAERMEFHGMIGRSAVMQQMFDRIRRYAPHVRTVLVTGETGTGKELVARALHRAGSRRDRRFVTINCSAVVETLFESELFGHVRGAFTGATQTKSGLFEHASGGTLFLDEAGELPLSLQAKLLRAVEYGEVQRVGSLETHRADVCVIAATNRNLRDAAESGRFRPDLYYRLSVIELHIPPLRERREDIPILTAAFVREFAGRLDRPARGLTSGAERILQEAAWPGNVRELRNVIERACILSDDRVLSEREVLRAMTSSGSGDALRGANAPAPVGVGNPGDLAAVPESGDAASPHSLKTAQRDQIRRVLREARGNKAEAAKLLGISRRSLYRWIDRLGL